MRRERLEDKNRKVLLLRLVGTLDSCFQKMVFAADAIRGQISAHSFATGPVIADPGDAYAFVAARVQRETERENEAGVNTHMPGRKHKHPTRTEQI